MSRETPGSPASGESRPGSGPLRRHPNCIAVRPEQRLMLAILADAANVMSRDPFGRDEPRVLAAAWLLSDDRAWAFSLVSICDALYLDLRRIRAALSWREVPLRRPHWMVMGFFDSAGRKAGASEAQVLLRSATRRGMS